MIIKGLAIHVQGINLSSHNYDDSLLAKKHCAGLTHLPLLKNFGISIYPATLMESESITMAWEVVVSSTQLFFEIIKFIT